MKGINVIFIKENEHVFVGDKGEKEMDERFFRVLGISGVQCI